MSVRVSRRGNEAADRYEHFKAFARRWASKLLCHGAHERPSEMAAFTSSVSQMKRRQEDEQAAGERGRDSARVAGPLRRGLTRSLTRTGTRYFGAVLGTPTATTATVADSSPGPGLCSTSSTTTTASSASSLDDANTDNAINIAEWRYVEHM